ncbi:MAG: glycerophosphodiester phosphodiesterase [Chitinophagaceae bacterium]|nr:glycerophosphodiester phosphodiesterase [Chitinophagaceae bacterium]
MKKYIVFIVTILFMSCVTTKNLQESSSRDLEAFDEQGHRGCRGLMPENTVPAMLRALDLGVTTLEMDVCITKDKQVIVSHDPFFSHDLTTRADGSLIDEKDEKNYKLYQMTYAETQQYDVGMKPHPWFPRQEKLPVHKPLLGDLVDSVTRYLTKSKRPFPYFNIETKSQPATDNIFHPGPPEFVELLMSVIKNKGVEEHVIIQSFDFRTLVYLHEHYPAVKTAMLIEGSDKRSLDDQVRDLGFVPTIYSPDYRLVNAELIKKCHQQKIKIIPWTVNDKAKINELKKAGVDGIISDYPDLFN